MVGELPPLQLPEHPAQCPEHILLSGQPMHWTPFFFSLWMYHMARATIPATTASTIILGQFIGNYFPLSAYWDARALLVFRIRFAMITPMTTTTARPRIAATMFREAGLVTRVPMVYTR